MRPGSRRRAPRAGALAVFLALVAPSVVQAADQIVLVLDRTTADVATISADLSLRGFRLDPPLWGDLRVEVRLAVDLTHIPVADLLSTVDAMRTTTGVVAAGEQVTLTSSRVTFVSDRVLVRFRSATSDAVAVAWGSPLGLTSPRPARGQENTFLFRARLRAADLQALEARAPSHPTVRDTTPVFPSLRAPSTLTTFAHGGYHRIPRRNDLVIVMADPGSFDDRGKVAGVVADQGGSLGDTADPAVKLAEFPPSASGSDMQLALKNLKAMEEVLQAGPLIALAPLAFLTDQLVVKFIDANAYYHAPVSLASFNLQEVRPLPYIEHGFLYRYPETSADVYDIYDAAESLMQQGLAVYAIPNLAIAIRNACGANNGCAPETNHDYMRLIHVCQVLSTMEPFDESIVVAVLDRGVVDHPLFCERLRVGRVIDFARETLGECRPTDPDDWCNAGCSPLWDGWEEAHGVEMALTIGAEEEADLLGVAPGVQLLMARPTAGSNPMSEVPLADALWWLAGGDPGWCRDGTNYPCTSSTTVGGECAGGTCDDVSLPARLAGHEAADVINLSFTRHEFATPCDESGTNGPICELICTDLEDCAIVGEVLDRIHIPQPGDGIRYPGGTVVVNAVGHTSQYDNAGQTAVEHQRCYTEGVDQRLSQSRVPSTALAEPESTIAVGSVYASSKEPFDGATEACVINHPGEFLDVVAPMGGNTNLCVNCSLSLVTSASSAATAVVSGVAAQMLRVNPVLTAPQVRCIIRETAGTDPPWTAAEIASWSPPAAGGHMPDCAFDDDTEHSICLGRGMVDMCEAVAASVACGDNPNSDDCPCWDDGTPKEESLDLWLPPGSLSLFVARYNSGLRLHLPHKLVVLLECLVRGDCLCAEDPGECLHLDLQNPYEEELHGVTVQMCIGTKCWTLPWEKEVWAAEEMVRIPITAKPEMEGWLRIAGDRARLQILSYGEPVSVELSPDGSGKNQTPGK